MAKNLIIAFLTVMVLMLAADCVWLHVTCERQREDIAALALDQGKTLKAVKNLENWVATSSVESKIKGYRKELEGYRHPHHRSHPERASRGGLHRQLP